MTSSFVWAYVIGLSQAPSKIEDARRLQVNATDDSLTKDAIDCTYERVFITAEGLCCIV